MSKRYMGLIWKYRCIEMEEQKTDKIETDKKSVLKKIKYPAIILGVLGAILLKKPIKLHLILLK